MTVVIKRFESNRVYGQVATGGPVVDRGRVVGQLGRRRKDVDAVNRGNAEVQDMLKQDFVAWG